MNGDWVIKQINIITPLGAHWSPRAWVVMLLDGGVGSSCLVQMNGL